MTKKMKLIVVTILGVLFVEGITLLIGAYSGIPDVAATTPEAAIVRWFFNTTKDRSISMRAKKIAAPSLGDSAQIALGFDHYHEMCVTCHGAPGRKPDELAQGLNPHAPNLAFSTRDMEPSEMFLVIRDGIKMTGMPGFGPTHSDSEIWAIVSFIQRLQTMSADQYGKFQKEGITIPGHTMEESSAMPKKHHHGSERTSNNGRQ